jgi:hypothetical protein
MTRGSAPESFDDPDRVADAIIARVGKNIELALPLGLGKANHVANALFARAAADPTIKLRIFTALTLEKPRGKGDLERRFLAPIADRVFAGYPELAYALALHAGTLPPNVKVDEFFFAAGTRQLPPRAALRARPRRQRGGATRRQARARRRDALQPELQPGSDARSARVPRAQGMRLSLRRTGQFGAALHARRRRHRGERIRPDAGKLGHGFSPVRAAAISPTMPRACTWRARWPTAAPCSSESGRSATRWRTRSSCGTGATRSFALSRRGSIPPSARPRVCARARRSSSAFTA